MMLRLKNLNIVESKECLGAIPDGKVYKHCQCTFV